MVDVFRWQTQVAQLHRQACTKTVVASPFEAFPVTFSGNVMNSVKSHPPDDPRPCQQSTVVRFTSRQVRRTKGRVSRTAGVVRHVSRVAQGHGSRQEIKYSLSSGTLHECLVLQVPVCKQSTKVCFTSCQARVTGGRGRYSRSARRRSWEGDQIPSACTQARFTSVSYSMDRLQQRTAQI